jgi:hypothetical protein
MSLTLPKIVWIIICKYADFQTFVNLILVEKSSKKAFEQDAGTKKRYIEYKLCWLAVNSDGNALKCVPLKYHSNQLYLKAVKQNGNALQFVPKEKRTTKLCLEAVKQNGYALFYIPEEKTEEICLEAVRQNGRALKYVLKKKELKGCVWKLLNKMDKLYNMFLMKKEPLKCV